MKDTESPVSKLERLGATAWLILRRTACFISALALAGGVVLNIGAFVRGVASIVDIAVQVPIGLALACFFVWVGIYGIAGRYRGAGFPYRLADTKWLYRRRKKRYGWRW